MYLMGSYRRCAWTLGIACLIAAILGVCGTREAWAVTALIMEPAADGVAPADQVLLRSAVETALQTQQLTLLPAADLEIAISSEPQLKDCSSELCFERLGRLLDSQIVVRYRVKPPVAAAGNQGSWRLNVELFDGEVGAMGARLTEDCSSCTSAQAAERLGTMIKSAVLRS
jgi:hypothetical protein